jgi:hypothetical protein
MGSQVGHILLAHHAGVRVRAGGRNVLVVAVGQRQVGDELERNAL